MIFISFIIAVLFFVIKFFWLQSSAAQKGRRGERYVENSLLELPQDSYFVFSDSYFSFQNRLTQIDHVVISAFGIFVIETKNYSGWIVGGENSEYWKKVMFRHHYSFQNPIKQNYIHVKALETILEIPRSKIFSIVVFLNHATIKVKSNACVINLFYLNETILNHREILFTNDEVAILKERFCEKKIEATKQTRKKHIAQIQILKQTKYEKIANGICPSCGGKLVERQGKYGTFTGCTNFPKCKFHVY